MPALLLPRRASSAPFRPALLTLATLVLAAAPSTAQIVRGTVVEADTDSPIPHAEVVLVYSSGKEMRTVLADAYGAFVIEADEPGRYTLSVRHIGFVAVSTPVVDVAESEAVTVQIRMNAEAIPLEPLVVVQRRWHGFTRLERFYERADWNSKLGIGRIYYHDDVKRYASVRYILATAPPRPMCPMRILVDGLDVGSVDDLDVFVKPEDVEGIEIYRGPTQVPQEYVHMTNCALALIWTRPRQGKPFTWGRFLAASGIFGVLTLLITR